MPEATVTPTAAPPADPSAPNTPPPTDGIYANGKFKGPAALEQAAREITTKLELPPLPEGPLFGEGKVFKDIIAVEAYYVAQDKILGRLSNAKPAEPAAPAPAPKPKPADPPGQMPTIPDPVQTADDDLDFEGVVKSAGLDMAVLKKTWKEKGELLPTDYAALKAKGYGKKAVNDIARNADIAETTLVTQTLAKLDEIAGSTDARQTMLNWAGTFYKGEELESMRRGINNTNTAVQAMKVIESDFRKNAPGTGSRPLVGGTAPPPSPAVGPYTDVEEYRAVLNKSNPTPEEQARFNATKPSILLGM